MKRNNQGQIMKGGLMAGIGEGAILLIIMQRIISDPTFQLNVARKFMGKNEYSMGDFAEIFIRYVMTRSYSNSVKDPKYYSISDKHLNDPHNKVIHDKNKNVPGFMGGSSTHGIAVTIPADDWMSSFKSHKSYKPDEQYEKFSKDNIIFLNELLKSVISSCENDYNCQLFKIWLYNTIVNFILFIPYKHRSEEENKLIKYLVVKRDNHISKIRKDNRTHFPKGFIFEFKSLSVKKQEPYETIRTIGNDVNLNDETQRESIEDRLLSPLNAPPSNEMNNYFGELIDSDRSNFGKCVIGNDTYKIIYLRIIGFINKFFAPNTGMSHFSTYFRNHYKDDYENEDENDNTNKYTELIDDSVKFYKMLNSFMIPQELSEWSSITRSYPNRTPPNVEKTDMILLSKVF